MNYNLNEILLVDEFRPPRIQDVILPPRLKKPFLDYVAAKGCPNLLLSGPKGIGKTTLVQALVSEIGATFLKVNASIEGIDIIRTKVRDFASAMNGSAVLFDDEDETIKRVVLFDEFDGMSKAGQEALRGFIEEFQHNCVFIFTCNYKEKIIDAMYSRCKCFDFQIRPDEHKELMTQFLNATRKVLDTVGIKYDPRVVAALIKQKFPDFRAVLNEIQGHSMSGELSSDLLAELTVDNDVVSELFEMLKAGKWDAMRSKIASVSNMDESVIMSRLVVPATLEKYVTKSSQPDFLCYVEEFMDRLGRSRDPQITLAALCTVLMKSVKYK